MLMVQVSMSLVGATKLEGKEQDIQFIVELVHYESEQVLLKKASLFLTLIKQRKS